MATQHTSKRDIHKPFACPTPSNDLFSQQPPLLKPALGSLGPFSCPISYLQYTYPQPSFLSVAFLQRSHQKCLNKTSLTLVNFFTSSSWAGVQAKQVTFLIFEVPVLYSERKSQGNSVLQGLKVYFHCISGMQK